MAWEKLPTDFTDAVWAGLKKYLEVDNGDGTISFQDVTVYSNKEKSFFGAMDANRMNEAMNIIMAMLENGTDLYGVFQDYFEKQKQLFITRSDDEFVSFLEYIANLQEQGDARIEAIKTEYEQDIVNFKIRQEELFNTWFQGVRDKLSGDVGAKLTIDIETLKTDKQNKISGIEGQIAGFDENGNLVAQSPPDTGVISFNGRRGEVLPESGDYNAGQVGADPAGTAENKVNAHNINPNAHQDIRRMAQTAQESAEEALKVITDIAYTINMIPSQSGSLSYTGNSQSPSWANYDPDVLTLGGTVTGTNAGSYSATFTPKGDYHWADGSKSAVSVTWSIGRASIASIPSQSSNLTYTGGAQSPSWSNYDSAKMTLGGTTSGTNAGSYSATFTPKANYQWNDGTTAAKTVSWSIGKAAGSLSISPTSLSITGASGTTKTISVTRAGDGAISASSSNTSVATVSVSGTTVTVTGEATGNTTITISVAAGTNHTAPSNKTCAVTSSVISTTLANNSWATIAQVSAAGNASSYWKVGDEKSIIVNGETLTLVIVGFNHDDLKSGGKAGITFGMKHLMKDTRQMNSSDTNSGGFTSSAMYAWLQNTLLPALPSDLRNVIKNVNKETSAGSGSSKIITEAMKLFLFSEIEIFGKITYSVAGEGSQYSYFATAANRRKNLQNGAGAAAYWWERSPGDGYSDRFCLMNSAGYAEVFPASFSGGICFGFCV